MHLFPAICIFRYFNSKEEITKTSADAEAERLLAVMNCLNSKEDVVESLTKLAISISIKEYNTPEQTRFIVRIYAEAARNKNVGRPLRQKLMMNQKRE